MHKFNQFHFLHKQHWTEYSLTTAKQGNLFEKIHYTHEKVIPYEIHKQYLLTTFAQLYNSQTN